MASTFLDLSSQLFSASTDEEKLRLSEDLSELLGQDHALTETLVAPLVFGVVSGVDSLYDLRSSEFYYLHHRAYRDIDGRVRVAIGVAFLQHFENSDEDLDMRVLEELYSVLKAQNLELLVNDLTVNTVQVRDGAFGSML